MIEVSPTDIPTWEATNSNLTNHQIKLLDALRLSNTTPSNSEARRHITSGAVYQIENNNEIKIVDPNMILEQGSYLFRIGKRKFINIKI